MQTKVISTSLLCMRWKIKSQLQSSLTCVSYCPSHQWLVRNVFYIHVYISTLHQGHSANSSHNCITSVTWLSSGKLYTCGNSRTVFFLHSTCGDIRERKKIMVFLYILSVIRVASIWTTTWPKPWALQDPNFPSHKHLPLN